AVEGFAKVGGAGGFACRANFSHRAPPCPTIETMQMGWRVGVWLLCSVLAAADTLPAPQFEKDVLLLLTAKCGGCHGPETHTAGLDLHNGPLVLRGRQNRPAAVTGSAPERRP